MAYNHIVLIGENDMIPLNYMNKLLPYANDEVRHDE